MRSEFTRVDPPQVKVFPLLTLEQVADWLQVAPQTIYQWRTRRPEPYGPPAIKVGKYLRWRPEVVQAWIEELERG